MMDELIRVLEEELGLYDALTGALEAQRDALVRLDRRAVEASALRMEALLWELRRISEARADLVQKSAAGLGRSGQSLRDLAEAAPEPHRQRIVQLRRDLLSRIRGMRGLAALSRTLLDDSLGRIRAFVQVLAGPSPVYANPRMAPARGLVDRSA